MSGQFFAIDRRSWGKACALGMNPAVAYLVLACGSGRDQKTTAWSAHAIETYTGISRTRSKAAIATLKTAGLVRSIEAGNRPRYEITPWQAPGKKKSVDPEWIWLPNSFVTGAQNETPPLELLRQAQDHMALRLAVDLYGTQNLVEDGGVSRNTIWIKYGRFEAGRQAQFTVWGFKRGGQWVHWNETTNPHRREKLTEKEKADGENPAIDFFPRTKILADAGIIEWVPYLVESESAESEIIHPMVMEGDDREARLGRAAHRAGQSMLTERQREWATGEGLILAPVPRHMINVQMVGIARLRYRPQTKMTGAWWADLESKCAAFTEKYEQIPAQIIAA
jgi:hypothetical protein